MDLLQYEVTVPDPRGDITYVVIAFRELTRKQLIKLIGTTVASMPESKRPKPNERFTIRAVLDEGSGGDPEQLDPGL